MVMGNELRPEGPRFKTRSGERRFCYEHHGMDARVRPLGGVSVTLSSRNTNTPGPSANAVIIVNFNRNRK